MNSFLQWSQAVQWRQFAWSASQEEKAGAHPFLQSRISASLRRLPFQRQQIPLLDV